MISSRPFHRLFLGRRFPFVLALACLAPSAALAETVLIDDDFSRAAPASYAAPGPGPLGWKIEGTRGWAVATHGGHTVLAADKQEPVTEGLATKTFALPAQHGGFTLTATAGVLWGRAGMGNGYSVDLLDAQGNGYRILCKRAKAAWAGQWTRVTAHRADKGRWGSAVLTGEQESVTRGGGLATLTITGDPLGRFTVASSLWGGAALRFRDTTTTAFTQVRLVADDGNNDRSAFGRVRLVAHPAGAFDAQAAANDDVVYVDFNRGQASSAETWVQAIRVSEPALRSEVRGDVTVRFTAPGMTEARAFCWSQPTRDNPNPWGHDVNLTGGALRLGPDGAGSFLFPADSFPNGPVNIRILAVDGKGQRDSFELQLFNLGGVTWNQGIPKTDPPAAKGLKLIFADDFDGPLSISKDGRGARYNAHKPRYGDFSGWPFTSPMGDGKPFSQTGTWLRISARKDAESPKGRTGLLASVNMDGEGLWAKAPSYLECRFVAQSAPGTWPAFWTLTHIDRGQPGDELDIVEAYGGNGKGHPNHPGYSIVSHFWNQTNADGTKKKGFNTRAPIMELGGKSYWSWTFHTYAVSVGLGETVYYFDDIEVLRHPTNEVSREKPLCFLINLAIGGISRWPIDLERYGNGSDMYVDYVRVYAAEPVDYRIPPPGK